MLDKTKNYKIDVSALTMSEKIRIQEELFKQGYRWCDNSQEVSEFVFDFLFLDNANISYCNNTDFFIRDKSTPIIMSDIIPQQESKKEQVIAPQDISLRDYFAGLALAGNIACSTTEGDFGDFARYAYRYADAMLKERSC